MRIVSGVKASSRTARVNHHVVPADAGASADLVFGLVGPVGGELDRVEEALEFHLTENGYQYQPVHVMKVLADLQRRWAGVSSHCSARDYEAKMNNGDKFRQTTKNNSVMALLAIATINSKRKKANNKQARNTWVIHSIKRPEGVKKLREVYGTAFFLISCYQTECARAKHIAGKIASGS